jgi:hypothetical protein
MSPSILAVLTNAMENVAKTIVAVSGTKPSSLRANKEVTARIEKKADKAHVVFDHLCNARQTEDAAKLTVRYLDSSF